MCGCLLVRRDTTQQRRPPAIHPRRLTRSPELPGKFGASLVGLWCWPSLNPKRVWKPSPLGSREVLEAIAQ